MVLYEAVPYEVSPAGRHPTRRGCMAGSRGQVRDPTIDFRNVHPETEIEGWKAMRSLSPRGKRKQRLNTLKNLPE